VTVIVLGCFFFPIPLILTKSPISPHSAQSCELTSHANNYKGAITNLDIILPTFDLTLRTYRSNVLIMNSR
jgi:hypothetical protein